MSGSFELGEKFGHFIDSGALVLYPAEREAFYHAARAEMAMEAADYAFSLTARSNFQTVEHYKLAYAVQEELRAMDDREGK